jgi:hypothetical protein
MILNSILKSSLNCLAKMEKWIDTVCHMKIMSDYGLICDNFSENLGQ